MCDNGYQRTWLVFNLLAIIVLVQCAAASSLVKREILSGNDDTAIDGGKKYFDGQQQQRKLPNDGSGRKAHLERFEDNIDLLAYANDFNMQDETSIPEDILDQQHIQDDDAIDADIHYAEPDDADIILESQKSTPRNSTGYDVSNKNLVLIGSSSNTNKNDNNNNNNKNGFDHNYKNMNRNFEEKKSNGNNNNKERPTNDNDHVIGKGKSIDYDEDDSKDDINYDEDDDDADGVPLIVNVGQKSENIVDGIATKSIDNGSDVNKKFKDLHGRINSGRQYVDVDVNEKLNKVPSMIEPKHMIGGDTNNKNNNKNNMNEMEPSPSIGDIEERNHNEDLIMQKKEQHQHNLNVDDDDDAIDSDESASEEGTETTRQSQAANNENFKFTENFITRKSKRHDGRRIFNGHNYDGDDDEDDGDGIKTNWKNDIQKQQQQPQHRHGNGNGNSNPNRVAKVNDDRDALAKGHEHWQWHHHLQQQQQQQYKEKQSMKEGAAQIDYSISNSNDDGDIFGNRSTTSIGTQQYFNVANEVKSATVLSAADGEKSKPKTEGADADAKAEAKASVAIQQHSGNQHVSPVEASTQSEIDSIAKSAFELHKAQRRFNGRYGHKSQKKKYKDYLRYAVTSTQSNSAANATATATATSNINRAYGRPTDGREMKLRKHDRKNDENEDEDDGGKSKGLPASPIFSVRNRNRNQNQIMGRHDDDTNEKPFYEGQINYFVETKDDDDDMDDVVLAKKQQYRASMDRMIAADNGNWYRRVSPVLRNGIKTSSASSSNADVRNYEESPLDYHHRRQHQQHYRTSHQHQYHRKNQHQHQQHQHPHQHQHHRSTNRSQHKHQHQHVKHHQSLQHQIQQQQQRNPYQRISSITSRKPTPYAASSAAASSSPSSPQSSETNSLSSSSSSSSSLSSSSSIGTVAPPLAQTPIPPPAYKQHAGAMQELGHQITQMDEFERYYAKWPHLARVQFQVYDEHFREAHPELYPDSEDEDAYEDYESAAELEEAQKSHGEDANLPPYIKKYNRRNKQLLNLLEGTLPPPTRPPYLRSGGVWSGSLLQPGPRDSSSISTSVRIDDDYLKAKRQRYHNRMMYANNNNNNNNNKNKNTEAQNLFAEQRSVKDKTDAIVVTNSPPIPIPYAIPKTPPPLMVKTSAAPATAGMASINNLPDEDVSVSVELVNDDNDWRKEIETKSNANELTGSEQMTWQIGKLTTSRPMAVAGVRMGSGSSAGIKAEPSNGSAAVVGVTTPKAIVFRLPSYPAIAGSFMSKPRSRSAQFAPNPNLAKSRSSFVSGNRPGNGYISAGGFGYNSNFNNPVTTRLTAAIDSKDDKKDNNNNNINDIQQNAPSSTVTTLPLSASNSAANTTPPSNDSNNNSNKSDSGGINSFVYHRVIDASPRLVGAGYTGGRKQRLPFVAITDRRLETSKKTLLASQKDFEQNHYPMP